MKRATSNRSFPLLGTTRSHLDSIICDSCQTRSTERDVCFHQNINCCPHRYRQEQNHGCGDPARKISVDASDFETWNSNLPNGGHGTLKSYTFEEVPCGRWEVVLVLKVNRLDFGFNVSVRSRDHEPLAKFEGADENRFITRLNFGTNTSFIDERTISVDQTINDVLLQNNNTEETLCFRRLRHFQHQWILLSLGKISLNKKQDVHFEWVKWPASNPGGGVRHILCRSVELRSVGETWEVLGLLVLCKMGRAHTKDIPCRVHLQDMPGEVLDLIADLIGYTPLPKKGKSVS